MEIPIAAKKIINDMFNGSFTRKKRVDYFSATKEDWEMLAELYMHQIKQIWLLTARNDIKRRSVTLFK